MVKNKKQKMNKLVLFLIPIGVAVNFVTGQIASSLALPFYLDTIGTISIGALCGSIPGAIVGILSSMINGFTYPVLLCFTPVNVIVGLLAGILSRKGFFKNTGKMLVAAIIFGIVGGMMSALITWGVYGFDFGIGPSSYVSIPLYKILHLNKFVCELIGSSAIDTIDKVISVVIMVGVFKSLPKRMVAKLPLGNQYIKDIVAEDEDDDF